MRVAGVVSTGVVLHNVASCEQGEMTMDPSTLNFAMAGAIVVITGGVYMLQRHSDARQRADDLAEGSTDEATEPVSQASSRLVSSNKPRQPKTPGRKQK